MGTAELRPGDEVVICQGCGRRIEVGAICHGCGLDVSAASKQDPCLPPLHHESSARGEGVEGAAPLRDEADSTAGRVRGGLDTCEKCEGRLFRKRSRLGTLLVIFGLGLSTVLAPVVRSWSLSAAGFAFLAFGIWKQSCPRVWTACERCGHRRRLFEG